MGAIAKNRKRLRVLELTAQGFQTAVTNIGLAQYALDERRERHERSYDEDEDDEEMAAENASYDRILQTILLSDREEIRRFIKEHTKQSDIPTEERIDLDAAGVDFAVLVDYLNAKITHARIRLIDAHR
jgi:hypothetical protein